MKDLNTLGITRIYFDLLTSIKIGRKGKIRSLVKSIFLLFLVFSIFAVFNSKQVLANQQSNKKGWLQEGDKWYYLDGSGVMQKGWLQEGDKWYYLDGSGVMQKGWLHLEDKSYYLDREGKLKHGFVLIGTNRYFFDYTTGELKRNQRESSIHAHYYVNQDGIQQRGYLTYKGEKFHFDEYGEMGQGWIVLQQVENRVYPKADLRTILDSKNVPN